MPPKIKTVKPHITLRIFSSGKVICQAATSLEDVYRTARDIIPVLYQFRQRNEEPIDSRTLVENFE